MKNLISRKTQNSHDTTLVQNTNFPLHDLGEGFFAMTTIEDGDAYFFNRLHRHNFYEVLWFVDVARAKEHHIDFIKYPIVNNQLFLLLPDQVHHLDPAGKTGFVFAMSRDFFERLIAADIFKLLYHSTHFSVVIPEAQLELFQTLIRLIQLENQTGKRPAILESYLRSWFLHCLALENAVQPDDEADSRMRFLIDAVEVHFKEQRKSSFYADTLSLSAKRLNELTRETFSKTVSQMINERLILEAKREISCGEKPIKEISYELGFSEPSYFTRFFGKQTGYSPENFRKRMNILYQQEI